MKLKRVIAMHDISCFGKCSLTVALPILSACGIECTSVPTAVLSTHTGGLDGYTYRDLTEDLMPIAEHWKKLKLEFNGVFTGFLGSFEQIETVKKYIEYFASEGQTVLVDPVMADNGVMYSLFDKEFAKGMASLCKCASIIVPNVTEACFLLEEKYEENQTREYIEGLMKRLSDKLCKKVVLTGVSFEDGKLGAGCYDGETGKADYYFNQRVEGYFHGTGDVFSSALLSGIMNGKTLKESIKIAVDFTLEAIMRTKEEKTDIRFGVDFEQSLPNLLRALGKV